MATARLHRAGFATRSSVTIMASPRLSSRTAWRMEENALSLALSSARGRGDRILDLTIGNPTSAGFDYERGLLSPLGEDAGLSYVPKPFGHDHARAAVARHYAARGAAIDEARVVITASTSEAYAFLFQLLADQGDELLVPAPSYPLFGYLADLAGVKLVPYPLAYDGAWHLDEAALRSLVSPRTRAILVVSPNNPTGSYLKRDELQSLRAIAEEHRLALVSDEVFADYPLPGGSGSERERAPTLGLERTGLAFALSGLSKVAALPQLKLAWMIVSGDDHAVAAAMERLELLADTYLSVATPIQLALSRLLESSSKLSAQINERTSSNLATLRAALRPSSAATLLDVEGGWYATLRVPTTRTEEEWSMALLARGVLVHPGHFFDFPTEAFLVVSLLTPSADFAAGVAILMELIDEQV